MATKPAKTPTTETATVAFATTAAFAIDLPATESRRGNPTKYPFDTLTAVGMTFGVTGKNAKQLSSVISAANRRSVEQRKDENGQPLFQTKTVMGADGQPTAVPDTEKPLTVVKAKYRALDVTAEIAAKLKGTPGEGATALVQRIV